MKYLIIILSIIYSNIAFAQFFDYKADVILKSKELLKADKFDEAVSLLDSAINSTTDNQVFVYEKAVAYFYKEKLRYSAFLLDSLVKSGYENEKVYQTLGNCYNYLGFPEKADTLFTKAVEKFPESALLNSELGYIKISLGLPKVAVELWENGIIKDPAYNMNYFPLSVTYSDGNDKMWSLIYGEIYLNLSDNESRASELSSSMYYTFHSAIEKKDDKYTAKLTGLSFKNDLDTFKIPFDVAYQKVFNYALNNVIKSRGYSRTIDFTADVLVKTDEYWFASGYADVFKNPLFDLHKKLLDAGFLKAYYYLHYKEGGIEEFTNYFSLNKKNFQDMVANYNKFRLNLDKEHFLSKYMFN